LTGGSGQDGTRLWKTNINEPEKDRSRTVDWQEPDIRNQASRNYRKGGTKGNGTKQEGTKPLKNINV
jgi:hypothetical protein